MRVLEARFHSQPREGGDAFVVVGHVVWENASDAERPVVQPSPALALGTAPATMLSKLQYLVAVTSPGAFERLQSLRSRFWSFVDVTPPDSKGGH